MKSTLVFFVCLLGLGLCGSALAKNCKFGAPTCTFQVNLPCPPAGTYHNKQMIGPWQFWSDSKKHPKIKTDGNWDYFDMSYDRGELHAVCTKVIPHADNFSADYMRPIEVSPAVMKYIQAKKHTDSILCKFKIKNKSATCTITK